LFLTGKLRAGPRSGKRPYRRERGGRKWHRRRWHRGGPESRWAGPKSSRRCSGGNRAWSDTGSEQVGKMGNGGHDKSSQYPDGDVRHRIHEADDPAVALAGTSVRACLSALGDAEGLGESKISTVGAGLERGSSSSSSRRGR